MGSSKKQEKPYVPWWLSAPLDPNKGMLEQWEYWTEIEPDPEEHKRMLDWLEKNVYRRPEAKSLFYSDPEIINPQPKDKLH